MLQGEIVKSTRRQMRSLLAKWEAKLSEPGLTPEDRLWFEEGIMRVRSRAINKGL